MGEEGHLSWGTGLFLFVLMVGGMLMFGSCARIEYPGEWIGVDGAQFNKIARTISANRVSGCGEYWYKLEGGEDRGEALVWCRDYPKDPFSPVERLITVWYETGKVAEGVSEGSEYADEPPPRN